MWETIDLDDHEKVIDFLQGQSNRIKDLEKREEQLLSEIEDFQELLAKNDDVCHKRVIDLIDEKIKKGEEAIEWGESTGVNVGAMGFHVEMLKLLKKELLE